jgi:hypothetical protein
LFCSPEQKACQLKKSSLMDAIGLEASFKLVSFIYSLSWLAAYMQDSLDIPMTNDGCVFPFVLLECS